MNDEGDASQGHQTPTCVALVAGAMVVVHQVYTGGAVQTLALAIVEVNVAVLPLPSLAAAALVVALQVHAGHGVDARPSLALV